MKTMDAVKRPVDLPANIPWCEKYYDSDDPVDPYLFDGSMTSEDYDLMHRNIATDRKHNAKKMKPYKRAMILLAVYFIAFCIKLALSGFMAWAVSGPLIEAATKERGYAGAYGGEWIIIIGVFVLTYYLTTKSFNSLINPKPKNLKNF